MSSPWSLEGELRKLAKTDSTAAALAQLGLARGEGCPSLEIVSGWGRSGAETYSLVFAARYSPDAVLHVRLKACVAFSLGRSLDQVLSSWISRRNALSSAGISTPHLYAWGAGLILEEEIPFDLKTALRSDGGSEVRRGVADLVLQLARSGFVPIAGFRGLRSRGRDVVIVDCGQDLGDPTDERASPLAILDSVICGPSADAFGLTVADIREIRARVEDRVGSRPSSH